MNVTTFLSKLNKATLEQGLRQQEAIETLLRAATHPPGFWGRNFGSEANTELEKARDALNPTGHTEK